VTAVNRNSHPIIEICDPTLHAAYNLGQPKWVLDDEDGKALLSSSWHMFAIKPTHVLLIGRAVTADLARRSLRW
jgi:hypothetical protein